MHKLLFVLLFAASISAQDPDRQGVRQDPARLDAARITSGELSPERFGPVRWLDGAHYATLEPAKDGRALELVRVTAGTGAREVLVPEAKLTIAGREQPLLIEDYAFSPDHDRLLVFTESERVWRQNTRGEYYIVPLTGDGAPRRLGGKLPKSTLMFCKFSPQGDRVAYVSQRDLYVEDAKTGAQTRLTSDGSDVIINGTFDWVYEEEFDCRDGFRWSPDGSKIAYWQLDCSGVGEFFMIDNLSDRYSKVVPVQYPKAGTTNSSCRVGVVAAAGGATTWMHTPGDPRETYLARMEWHPAGKELMVQWLPRKQNEVQVLACDAGSGSSRLVLSDTDAAYVDIRDDFRWLDGGDSFFWTSDRDGWRHGYAQPWGKGEAKLLTPGDLDVMEVELVDLPGGHLYFAATQPGALQSNGQRYLWDALPQPHPITRAYPDPGGEQPAARTTGAFNDYDISPDGSLALHTVSSFDVPPRIELVKLPSHEVVRVLAENKTLADRYARVAKGRNEFFQVKTADDVTLDGWVMYPPDFDPSKKWPVLFHVYGEPWAQTVMDTWFLNHHLFHRWLTQLGYVVMSLDARGTPAPRGRAWRKALYQKIGITSSRDWDNAVGALCAQHSWMDASRLAIWGWSGGGSMTLNMLLRYPDRFAAGMSVAPVTHLALYDTIYQERYSGDPREVPGVYEQCSPLTFAKNLRAHLLLVHGTGDDNVHFQNSEMLFDAFVAAGKKFEYLAYPNRTHAIREGVGTRKHLYDSLADFLQRRVQSGAQ